MRLEEKIMSRKHPIEKQLLEYGFRLENNQYIFTKELIEDMDVVIIVENNQINARVIDQQFNEEYVNFRIEGKLGSYAASVKNAFVSLLEEICEKCYVDDYFISEQANLLANYIQEKYHISPDYPFDEDNSTGVFRHENDKWFGLIMYIPYIKLDSNYQGEVEVLNIKIDEDRLEEYLEIDGCYRCYHMSKKSWMSIILDGRVDLSFIKQLLDRSYDLVDDHLNYHEWIVPCNAKYFDIENLFLNQKECIWKQSSNIHIGDLVYIYASKPFSSILYQCEVLDIDIPYSFKNDLSIQYIMKLKHLHSYEFGEFTLDRLKEYGVNTVRGPRHIPNDLSDILHQSIESF